MASSLINKNVVVDGRRTSIRLEREMWDALDEICDRECCKVHEIATMVNSTRWESTLTAAMRVFIMRYFRDAATGYGHRRAGHGQGKRLRRNPQHTQRRLDRLVERQRRSSVLSRPYTTQDSAA